MPTDLRQEWKIRWGHGDFRQGLHRQEACQLGNMDFIGAKGRGWLRHEGLTGQEIDGAGSPGLTWERRLANREDIQWTVNGAALLFEPNTGIGD